MKHPLTPPSQALRSTYLLLSCTYLAVGLVLLLVFPHWVPDTTSLVAAALWSVVLGFLGGRSAVRAFVVKWRTRTSPSGLKARNRAFLTLWLVPLIFMIAWGCMLIPGLTSDPSDRLPGTVERFLEGETDLSEGAQELIEEVKRIDDERISRIIFFSLALFAFGTSFCSSAVASRPLLDAVAPEGDEAPADDGTPDS